MALEWIKTEDGYKDSTGVVAIVRRSDRRFDLFAATGTAKVVAKVNDKRLSLQEAKALAENPSVGEPVVAQTTEPAVLPDTDYPGIQAAAEAEQQTGEIPLPNNQAVRTPVLDDGPEEPIDEETNVPDVMPSACSKKPKPKNDTSAEPAPLSKEIEWMAPQPGEWATATVYVWHTKCGNYRATRALSTVRGDGKEPPGYYGLEFLAEGRYCVLPDDKQPGTTYAKRFRTLRAALEAAERMHRDKLGDSARLDSNLDQTIDAAIEAKLANFEAEAKAPDTGAETEREPEEEETMNEENAAVAEPTAPTLRVDPAKVVELFKEAGWHQAGKDPEKWTGQALVKRISKMIDMEEETWETVTSPDGKELLTKLLAHVGSGGKIELENEPEGANGRMTTATKEKVKRGRPKGSKNAAKKVAGEPKAPRTTKAHRGDPEKLDKFGSPMGSSNAIVNSVLSKTPKTTAEIIKETKLSPSQVRYAHLKNLVKKKAIKKSAEGWFLV